ncbi:MAG TPA: hypothetical protein VMG08_12620 [Allosphingosinicella sp.]|nr:hypothetical protein [Allosphingosinicella sp.]
MKLVFGASLLLLAACSVPAPVTPAAAPLRGEGQGPVAAPLPDPHLSAGDIREIADLIAETQRVIGLPAFERNLRAVEAEFGLIRQSRAGRELSAAMIADLYAGRDPRYRFRPVMVGWNSSESTSITREGGTILLATNVRDRWRLGTVRSRALAINSLAHEFAHTLSRGPAEANIDFVFTDGGSLLGWFSRRAPVATYTIGTVAQCTFLEEQMALRGSLFDCMRRYGLSSFRTYGDDG